MADFHTVQHIDGPHESYGTCTVQNKAPGGSWVSGASWNTLVRESYSRSLGQNIDRYYKRLHAGELLPMTYWQQFERAGTCAGRYHISRSNGSEVRYFGEWARPGYVVPLDGVTWAIPQGLLQALVQAAAAKAYSQGWDGLTFALELKELRKQFKTLVKDIIKIIKDWKKYLRQKGRYGTIDDWLGGRYGWRTLLYDMQDINEAIQKLDDESRSRVSTRTGTVWSTDKEDRAEGLKDFAGGGIASYTMVTRDVAKLSCRGSIVADFTPSIVTINPVTTAWEKITLSFVIDWAFQVGGWLESLSLIALSSDYTAASGVQMTYSREYFIDDVVPEVGVTVWAFQLQGSCQALLTERTPSSIPSTPQFRLKLDPWKVLDLLAIALQRFL